jgi:pimeloyl-ACP methyl ester carboxylesterase
VHRRYLRVRGQALAAGLLVALCLPAGAAGGDGSAVESPARADEARPLPTVHLPAPSGPAKVGTLTVELATKRPETFTAAPDDTRRVPVQLWYPAAAGNGCVQPPYMDEVTARAVADDLPADFAASVRLDACRDARVAPGRERYPVVLFSHGLGATRFGATALLEELASRGFVVAAIHHTYGSRMTVLADGTQAAWDESQWETPAAVDAHHQVWVDDARDVLAFLAELDARRGFALAGRLDLERIAYVGHSFGGATAVATALQDRRIRAVVDLDGGMFPSVARPIRLDVPLLVVLSQRSPRKDDWAASDRSHVVEVAGATHSSFTDAPLLREAAGLPTLPVAGGSQPLSAAVAIDTTRAIVSSFLACSLRAGAGECRRFDDTLAALISPAHAAPISAQPTPRSPS